MRVAVVHLAEAAAAPGEVHLRDEHPVVVRRDRHHLREVPRATCGDVVVIAERKVADIDAKISDLRAMRAALTKLLKECPGSAPIAQCPIIESLAECGNRTRKKGPVEG